MADRRVEALALYDAGVPVSEIAEQKDVNEATVYRWIKAAKDNGPGPTERAMRALVWTWGDLDPTQAMNAESLIGLAVIADVGRSRGANGAERNAAVAALKELKVWIGELGQANGYEELLRALRDG